MAAKTDITLKPAADVTLEQARDARARAWKFIFDCHAKKKAAAVTSNDGDDTKEGSLNDFRADPSLP